MTKIMNVNAVSNRFSEAHRIDLRIDGLLIVHEEVDVIDVTGSKRVYPTLSRWKSVCDRLRHFYWKDIDNTTEVGLSIYDVLTPVHFGELPPRMRLSAECVHVVIGCEKLSIVLFPELFDHNRMMMARRARMEQWSEAERNINTGMFKEWAPSRISKDGKLSEYDSIVATRMFVLASLPKCADDLVTMAMLAI